MRRSSRGAGVHGHLPRAGRQALLAALTATGVTSSMASAGVDEPLEVVAVDVSAFPTVVIDVALPAWESVEQVGPEAFTVTGGDGLLVERLDPAGLTVAFVVDNGAHVPLATLAAHQGAAIELIRNLPQGVTVALGTTSGPVLAPTDDRSSVMAAVSRLDTAGELDAATLGPAVIHAAAMLEVADDSRRQLIVLTGDGIDVTAPEATAIGLSLDRALAAMRVVAVGDDVGPNLASAAVDSGGLAVGIGEAGGAVVRAIDVLTTTLTDQYRLTVTLTAPGPLTVRLTVSGRVYETTVPDPSPPAAATSVASSAVASSTVPARTEPIPAPSTTLAPPRTAGPTTVAGTTADRAPSPMAGVEAVFGVAAIALIVVAVRRRRRH